MTTTTPAAWQKGYPLEQLKQFADLFRECHKPFVYGAFGLLKERDVASALSEGKLIYTLGEKPQAAALFNLTKVNSQHYDFAQRRIDIPGNSLLIKALAVRDESEGRRMLGTLLQRARGVTDLPVWCEIFEEDGKARRLLESYEFRYVATKVAASSDLKGLYCEKEIPGSIVGQLDRLEIPSVIGLPEDLLSREEQGTILSELKFYEADASAWEQHYCVDVSQRILTADLRWVKAGDLKLNDELVGFDEYAVKGKRRKFRASKVTAHSIRRENALCVTLDDGSQLVSTEEHPWLAIRFGTTQSWVQAADLRPGDLLPRLFTPWQHEATYNGGWMAGFLDGEAYVGRYSRTNHNGSTVSTIRLGMAQKPGAVLDQAEKLLRDWGFRFQRTKITPSGVQVFICVKAEAARLLGMTRPVRLLPKATPEWLGVVRADRHQRVVRVEAIGRRLIAAMSTSTGTYVAEGFGSHNSSYNKRQSWTAFALQGFKPEDAGFIIKPSEMSKQWKEENADLLENVCALTPAAEFFPKTLEIIERYLPRDKERIRFMRLAPGGELTRHADITDRQAGTREGMIMRMHIPIVTNKDCRFHTLGLRGEPHDTHFRERGLFYLDTRKPHAVKNEGKTARIHLVVDTVSTESLRAKLEAIA